MVVLDDYQRVALTSTDWEAVRARAAIRVFDDHVTDIETLAARLADCEVVVLMRERTPFPADLFGRLPSLRLLVSTGRKNSTIDLAAARVHDVTVCGTDSLSTAPAEHTWALILAAARHLDVELDNVRNGQWQSTLGRGLAGRTLGVIGLGRIGSQVAAVGVCFGMEVVAWSPRLTAERAEAAGVRAVDKEDLLRVADVVTLHLVLSDSTRGAIGKTELALMKPSALLVNTARSGLVDTAALLAAVKSGALAAAALDVFDIEPLPVDDPLRHTAGVLVTPHLGFVADDVYALFYSQVVEDILAFWDGSPVRRL